MIANLRRARRTTRNKTFIYLSKVCSSIPAEADGLISSRDRSRSLVLLHLSLDACVLGFTEDLIENIRCMRHARISQETCGFRSNEWFGIYLGTFYCMSWNATLRSRSLYSASGLAFFSILMSLSQLRSWDSLDVHVWHGSFSSSSFLKEHQGIVQLLSLS